MARHPNYLPGLLLCASLLSAFASQASAPHQKDNPAFAGTASCAACHAEQHQAWRRSHHDLAMQEVDATTVLGDFEDATFVYHGIRSRFFRTETGYWVETDGPDGKLDTFKVAYVFGVYPLQQYLLALPGGRLQALSIAWDSRAASDGGQRWYHLYPDEAIDAKDPLHWTGTYQNWNSRCAECHSTDFQKHFDPETNQYSSTWYEVNVGCEACHGPGARHIELVQRGQSANHAHAGLALSLAERGDWRFNATKRIAERSSPPSAARQIDACGRCHSRRSSLGEYHYNKPLLDTHQLSLLASPLYYADGQIRDEVYVYGSFVQSKMHQAGVVCSNCHEPHSNQLRAPGNGVCAQCHLPSTYDVAEHHRHPPDSSGAQCVSCHMPATTYMGVDARPDHSLRIPRPDLSLVFGTPNACNQCHDKVSPQWSVQALKRWGIEFADTTTHRAHALHLADQQHQQAVPLLQQLAGDPSQPVIWRASALNAMGQFASRATYDEARRSLAAPEPLLRMSAVDALGFLPIDQRWQILNPLIEDPVKSVRMAVARQLAGTPLERLDKASADALTTLLGEYRASLMTNADMPGIQMQLANLNAAQQRWAEAEAAYDRALLMNPQLLPALMNLADLHRARGHEDRARQALQRAIAIAPEQGASYHALGLLESRTGNQADALRYLGQAADLEQSGFRHNYIYAIALHDYGQREKAIEVLKHLLQRAPENPDVLVALVNYSQELGNRQEARDYADRLIRLYPANPQFKQLYDTL